MSTAREATGDEGGPQPEVWTRNWGGLLRTARQVAGFSLAQLSGSTGLSRGYLSKLESSAPGALNPSRATLAALARALPSFGPLAHMLAPELGAEQLNFARTRPPRHDTALEADSAAVADVSHDHSGPPAHGIPAEPLQLGWRELEVLVALTSLQCAALPLRITEPMLARAVGRRQDAVVPVLLALVTARLVNVSSPDTPGGPPCYRLAPEAARRVGIARLGDVLILAAALISSTLPSQPTPAQVATPTTTDVGERTTISEPSGPTSPESFHDEDRE